MSARRSKSGTVGGVGSVSIPRWLVRQRTYGAQARLPPRDRSVQLDSAKPQTGRSRGQGSSPGCCLISEHGVRSRREGGEAEEFADASHPLSRIDYLGKGREMKGAGSTENRLVRSGPVPSSQTATRGWERRYRRRNLLAPTGASRCPRSPTLPPDWRVTSRTNQGSVATGTSPATGPCCRSK